ncbi:Uu.00g125000.m01.CDS01 [Anthostomella pinea]|uniref:Uu.00g125000.m01.CDS01 n=1 Tax=Anthostomella pinea TaxID=933095 RepID=A0AAI8VI87_9PEZI|nr:Uu.00g125000.m01.CDS01 [Anthostomella pinea]
MLFNALLLLASAALISGVVCEDALSKPALGPSLDRLSIAAKLESELTATKTVANSSSTWSSSTIPEAFQTEAANYGFNGDDMEAFDVQLEDCSEKWTFCRHQQASIQKHKIIELFSKLPLGMRNYVKHLVIIPGLLDGKWAGMTLAGISVFDDSQLNLYIPSPTP